ncbi:MAG: hypothetical protein ACYTDV_20245 [Planctomycetota bacterium]|jgi:hypothetical protein
MSDQTQDKSTTHRRWKRITLSVIAPGLLIVAAVLIWSRSRLPSIEERLAAIEAARAIPDSENAAILYNQLLENPGAVSLDDSLGLLDPNNRALTRWRPWFKRDHPELADWIEERQWLIHELIAAAQFEKCRFRIDIEPDKPAGRNRRKTMIGWAHLLIRAANHDVAEGRIDAAMEKWRCLVKFAGHRQQQCVSFEYVDGIRLEALAVSQASAFVVQGSPDEHRLQRITSLPFEIQDDWDATVERLRPVDELMVQDFEKELSLVDRLKYEFGVGVLGSMKNLGYGRMRAEYERVLVYKRGLHILVALRRYRNEHHRWPHDLDEIRARISAEVLVDPINKGDFVYKPTSNGFNLYSSGRNKLDEVGRHEGINRGEAPDDWPVWPPRDRRVLYKDTDDE